MHICRQTCKSLPYPHNLHLVIDFIKISNYERDIFFLEASFKKFSISSTCVVKIMLNQLAHKQMFYNQMNLRMMQHLNDKRNI